jgi:hypothetical protein
MSPFQQQATGKGQPSFIDWTLALCLTTGKKFWGVQHVSKSR